MYACRTRYHTCSWTTDSHPLENISFKHSLFVRTPSHDDVRRLSQVLGDGSKLGTFTSSGTTLDFENWTLNAKDVSTIKLVARGLGYNDWLSITEVSQLV